jgi:hypothetical protein
MRWWLVFVAGGLCVLLPGVINPLAVINGSTLIGLGLLAWASLRIVEGDRR